VLKFIVFEFVNSFVCLFYTAFYLQDMDDLRVTLASLLITTQVQGQVMEAIVPFIVYRYKKRSAVKHIASVSFEGVDFQHKPVNRSSSAQRHVEATKDEFDNTLEDYLEMYLQFGYVFLFSSVFPSAAFWALLNNVTEIRSDAFKMCRIFRRPFAVPTGSIGAWQVAFEAMNVIAVICNTALIMLSPSMRRYNALYGSNNVLLAFVFIEHVILVVKVLLSLLIPDAPGWVQEAVDKVEYQAKMARRAQRLEAARKLQLEAEAQRSES
jgi:hypothetical protein